MRLSEVQGRMGLLPCVPYSACLGFGLGQNIARAEVSDLLKRKEEQ